MSQPQFLTISAQVASYLRREIEGGRWRGTMPGLNHLARELGVNVKTAQSALRLLEKQGLLIPQGPGRRRLIVRQDAVTQPRALRVKILLYEESDRTASYMVDLLHRLEDAGHNAAFAEKSMRDLGMSVKRIARFVGGTETDAWVVMAGSREVLEWFAGQETPTFGLFGRNSRTPLASLSLKKKDALIELIDRLVDLGHRRIVILAREERRKPVPAVLEQLFLDRLKERGIPTGPYNLPDWGDSPGQFHQVFDSLFKYTPPTALIIDQPSLCVAVLQHLSQLGITTPDDVSLACTDMSASFEWCEPGIAHVTWDSRRVVNRVVKWANRIGRGRDDRRKSTSRVKLVPGGTIGPVPTNRND